MRNGSKIHSQMGVRSRCLSFGDIWDKYHTRAGQTECLVDGVEAFEVGVRRARGEMLIKNEQEIPENTTIPGI